MFQNINTIPKESHKFSMSSIKKDMNYYEKTKNLPSNLQSIKQILNFIPPTSIEPERTFSLCNYFLTKVRNRLSDKSINTLVSLKNNI